MFGRRKREIDCLFHQVEKLQRTVDLFKFTMDEVVDCCICGNLIFKSKSHYEKTVEDVKERYYVPGDHPSFPGRFKVKETIVRRYYCAEHKPVEKKSKK